MFLALTTILVLWFLLQQCYSFVQPKFARHVCGGFDVKSTDLFESEDLLYIPEQNFASVLFITIPKKMANF